MDVIVSMAITNGRMLYHKPGCMYVKKMKKQNRMSLSYIEAKNRNYHSCKYCRGLQGEIRCKRPNWEQQYNINVDYAKKQKHCMYVQI